MLSKRETHNSNIYIMYQYYALYHYVNIYHVFHVLFMRFMLFICIVYGDEHVCLCQIKYFDLTLITNNIAYIKVNIRLSYLILYEEIKLVESPYISSTVTSPTLSLAVKCRTCETFKQSVSVYLYVHRGTCYYGYITVPMEILLVPDI